MGKEVSWKALRLRFSVHQSVVLKLIFVHPEENVVLGVVVVRCRALPKNLAQAKPRTSKGWDTSPKLTKHFGFEPEQEASFLTDSFGLSEIDYRPVRLKLSSQQTQQPVKPARKRSFTLLIVIMSIVIVIGGAGVAIYFYNPGIISKFKNILTKAPVTEVAKTIETTPSTERIRLKPPTWKNL